MRYTYKVRDLRPGETMVSLELPAVVISDLVAAAVQQYRDGLAINYPEYDPIMIHVDVRAEMSAVPVPPVPAKKGRKR